jgi:UDP-N-acetylmuramate dehydrogenase
MQLVANAILANTLALPARAQWYACPTTGAELSELLMHAHSQGWPVTVLGEGSNVILPEMLTGLIVRPAMRGMAARREADGSVLLDCGAGENWDALVRWTIAQGVGGLENLSLIPGSVGAAPYQNIGAYGLELADVFDSLEACSIDGQQQKRFSLADCQFGYRDSVFKSIEPGRWVITAVRLRLPGSYQPILDYADLARRFAALPVAQRHPEGLRALICGLRRSKLPDPAKLANAGSFFKNPVVSAHHYEQLKQQFPEIVGYLQPDGRVKLAAGWLIERAGWKGRRLGDVGMHASQALVLVNYGGANVKQVLDLASQVQMSVQEKFGVELEREPVLLR